jgi:hypothetical protein
MARRTFNRQPYTVSTNGYSGEQVFTQVEFKGLCDVKNDVAVDQSTFADVENMYIDNDGLLTSRPPLKFADEEDIVGQWVFGPYVLRMYRKRYVLENDKEVPVKDFADYTDDMGVIQANLRFNIKCVSHNTYGGELPNTDEKARSELLSNISYFEKLDRDYVPDVKCLQIEDKIFIWCSDGTTRFADRDINVLNTRGIVDGGNRYLYFEDAEKYFYVPISKLVINGLESDYESRNFFTGKSRKRHQQSLVSAIDFSKLRDKEIAVRLKGEYTGGLSQHLYDIKLTNNAEKLLIYPQESLSKDYRISVVSTTNAEITLRYDVTTKDIDVSFNGNRYIHLPPLIGIIGEPFLSEDGMWAIAFTQNGIAKFDLTGASGDTLTALGKWSMMGYLRYARENSDEPLNFSNFYPLKRNTIDETFVPRGVFKTDELFTYIVKTDGKVYLYTEWYSGDKLHSCLNNVTKAVLTDEYKIDLCYAGPTAELPNAGPTIALLSYTEGKDEDGFPTSEIQQVNFQLFLEKTDGTEIKDGDFVGLIKDFENYPKSDVTEFGFVHNISRPTSHILEGDCVFFSQYPEDLNLEDNSWNSLDKFVCGDYVIYTDGDTDEIPLYVYRCVKDNVGEFPSTKDNTYWLTIAEYVEPRYSIRLPVSGRPPFARGAWCTFGDSIYINLIENNQSFPQGVDEIDKSNGFFKTGFSLPSSAMEESYGLSVEVEGDNTLITLIEFLSNKTPIYKVSNLYTDETTLTSSEVDVSLNTLSLLWGNKYDLTMSTVGTSPIETQTKSVDVNTICAILFGISPQGSYDGQAKSVITVGKNGRAESGYLFSSGQSNSGKLEDDLIRGLIVEHLAPDALKIITRIGQEDVSVSVSSYQTDKITYEFSSALSVLVETDTGYEEQDVYWTQKRAYYILEEETKVRVEDFVCQSIKGGSRYYKIGEDTSEVVTDRGIYVDGEFVELSNNRMLERWESEETPLSCQGELMLTYDDVLLHDKMMQRLNDEGTEVRGNDISSGDVISYVENATKEEHFLTPSDIDDKTDPDNPVSYNGNRYVIEVVKPSHLSSGEWNVSGKGTAIKVGDFVRLRSYDKDIILPPYDTNGEPTKGNSTGKTLTIFPTEYPASPTDWQAGDDWPEGWPTKPIYPVGTRGEMRYWQPGDALPTGPVEFFGYVSVKKDIKPVRIMNGNVYYSIDNVLWTSAITDNNVLELDEEVGKSNTRTQAPLAYAESAEHYFAFFHDGQNRLEISMPRKDIDKRLGGDGTENLLYLPEENSQIFPTTITNIFPLSDTVTGVFTENEVYYVGKVNVTEDSTAYTKAVKSKLPLGCRKGCDVSIGFDGQGIVFATERGIAVLAPEHFIATSEPSLTYLTDNIQDTYYHFYNDKVNNVLRKKDEKLIPSIKITPYRFWLIFYRYLDRDILAYDTRNGSWWKWSTQYPIISMRADSRLRIVMKVEYLPNDTKASPGMREFLWSDREFSLYNTADEFPGVEYIETIYTDDIIPETGNGKSQSIYENKFVGSRRVLEYATSTIPWHFTSQKLHFGQIYNYKAIKALQLNVKGTESVRAKLSTKAYRDTYHPENSLTTEILINDLRSFVKRVNITHVTNFQYKLENDTGELQSPLKLNALGIKYEVKERIR